jgi:hypothetical protein
MASILLSCGALVSNKIKKEHTIRKEHKRDYEKNFEEMKAENARLHAERQKLQQLWQGDNIKTIPQIQPPRYDGVVG